MEGEIASTPWWAFVSVLVAVLSVLAAVLGIGAWVGGVNSDRTNFRDFMKEIRADFKTILTRLPPTPAPVASESPLRLTEFGKRIAERAGVREWAAIVADDEMGKVQTLAGEKAYLVDEFCEDYVRRHLGETYEAIVKECSYEFGIPQEGVRVVFKVVLRDALLQRLGLVEA